MSAIRFADLSLVHTEPGSPSHRNKVRILAGAVVLIAILLLAAAPAATAPERLAGEEPAALSQLDENATARLHPALRYSLARQAAAAGQMNTDGAAWRAASLEDCVPGQAPTSGFSEQMCAASAGADDYLPIIVEWRRDPAVLASAAALPDRLAQRQQLVAALQADATQQTIALQAVLETAVSQGQARNVRDFWISPVIALEAQPALIASLAARTDIVQVRPDEQFTLGEVSFESVTATAGPSALPWNLAMLDVALAQHGLGLDGAGVTVAIMDTGVDWQHPALLRQYRGYRDRGLAVHRGNWHVATGEPYLYPGDGYGHGTHVMGTIVGDDGQGNRIGVAPAARWIAVKLFNNAGYTYESWIHAAFQWVIAPEGDPALAPDVVNNSWGNEFGGDARFRPNVQALRAAGILPIFSAGNSGPYPKSVGSPASHPEAFAVGAVDREGRVASFSARGPSPWDEVKPEVVAPGVNIRSAFPGGGYAISNGTSMAAPHAAGLVALLLQANPTSSPNQLEAILAAAARPLAQPVPNNTSGWGLINAYAAGLRLLAHGELTGRVVRSNGQGIAFPTVSAAPRPGGQPVTIAGDGEGAFSLALPPGLYTVTAGAFGFQPATLPSVEISASHRASITVTLNAQPAGVLFGRITDLTTGAPVSATVTLAGVPTPTRADPNTGLYSFPLPAGSYTATVTAEAYRLGRFVATISAGQAEEVNVGLQPGPRILLVDSGHWYYKSQIGFFEDALTALDYPYTLWPIRDPFGINEIGPDVPYLRLLRQFDVVIWSAPQDAPGIIGADAALAHYLLWGGHLLLSGQDVAFWDGGGSPLDLPAQYMTRQLGLWFATEDDRTELIGTADGPLAGLRLQLNTPDSAKQQRLPDAVTIRQPVVAQPALVWPDGPIGGAVAGRCRPFRAAWLGFGLEGAGPRATRIATFDRLLAQFAAAPAIYDLTATAPTEPLIGWPGDIVTRTLTIQSTGEADDLVDLQVEGGPWPLTLALPDGQRVQAPVTLALPSCTAITVTAEIAIPTGLPRDARSVYTVRASSQNDPAVHATVNISAKTPAPIVLVDDERWYNHEDRYIDALTDLGLSFDVFSTRGGDASPPASVLQFYPVAVWTTGYDWFRPLSASDLPLLSNYLDGGGRLLLSSQDLLDFKQNAAFAAERLGVASALLSVETTDVLGLTGSPLGEEFGPWRLRYPFTNWSDGIMPQPDARALLQDQNQHIVAVGQPAARWRTAFFAFPLETLAPPALATLLGHTLVWLSPLGESRLEAPPFAAWGAQIPVTLTLGLADDRPRPGTTATLPLPPELDLVPGSVRGPWQTDATGRTLTWAGPLAPGEQIVMSANLAVQNGLAENTTLPLAAQLDAGDGLILVAQAPVRVAVPWLTLRETGPDREVTAGSVAELALDIVNVGHITATARLTNTLPAGLTLLPETVQISRGAVTAHAAGLNWQDTLAPGAAAAIRFDVRVTASPPPPRLTDWTELTDQNGRRVVAWTTIHTPQRGYLPLVLKGSMQ